MEVAPVLFLIFNRPDHTQEVFESIRRAKPKKLFIAADGPRKNNTGDLIKCKDARNVVEKVDWDCQVERLYRNENLGCGRAVSEAITWFFKHVDHGIILEDDCLPDSSFFRFCTELLDRYKNDPEVFHISGINRQLETDEKADYHFTYFPSIWGWATWRRSWVKFDYFLEGIKPSDVSNYTHFLSTKNQMHFYKSIIRNVKNGNIDTWDHQWTITVLKNKGKAIIPSKNLISNIGFGTNSTHTSKDNFGIGNMTRYHLTVPLKHPLDTRINEEVDDVFRIPIENKGIYYRSKNSFKHLLKTFFRKFI